MVRKKIMTLLLAAMLVCLVFAGGAVSALAEESAQPVEPVETPEEVKSDALFVKSVTMTKGADSVSVNIDFDKAVAEEEKDVTDTHGGMITINGASLKEIGDAALSFKADRNRAVVTVPISALSDGDNKIIIFEGFKSDSGFVTTVRYIYNFEAGKTVADRVYRSEDLDDYEEVTITSVSVPEKNGSNTTFYIYLSDAIAPKKMIDMQVRSLTALKGYHGSGVTDQPCYSDEELDLLHRYQVISSDNPKSILYNFMFGCKAYNGMKMHPANHNGDASAVDMTPYRNIGGVDAYNLYQCQERVADTTAFYISEGETKAKDNGGSMQPLSYQIHMEANRIQIVFKGDSTRDKETKVTKILTSAGVETDATSFCENTLEDMRQPMLVGLKSGFLFPNGKIVKQDVFFSYDPVKKSWIKAGDSETVVKPDDTLNNQQGYTDEELAALAPKGGCGGAVAADRIYTMVFALPLLLAGAAVLAVRKGDKRESK